MLYARYVYDTWGNTLHIYNASGGEITSTANLAMQNPIRYRGYYFDAETGFYYLQSRYYAPVTCRFLNADAFIDNRGHNTQNLFAYCANNPIIRVDASGGFWEIMAAGAISASISGISNALITASSGTTFKECIIAGVAGFIGGIIGFGSSLLFKSPFHGNVFGRLVTTVLTDIGTILVNNGKITMDDGINVFVDVLFDFSFSSIFYFYNPISNIIPNATFNAIMDGVIDFAESKVLFSQKATLSDSKNIEILTFKERRLSQ